MSSTSADRSVSSRMPSSSIRNASAGTADAMRHQAAAAAVRTGMAFAFANTEATAAAAVGSSRKNPNASAHDARTAKSESAPACRRKNSTSFASSPGFTQGLAWLERAISANNRTASDRTLAAWSDRMTPTSILRLFQAAADDLSNKASQWRLSGSFFFLPR